ncbi:MAG TPA: hypothetical protein VEL79_14540 [Vicinamibacterales bacterium]|nr:hypothetical protein [Vicinamibacterales bacterium]
MATFGLQNLRQRGAVAVSVVALGALVAGCSASARPESIATTGAAGVSCEPNQRAVVRQVVVNGAPESQFACTSVGAFAPVGTTGGYGAAAAYQPVSYAYTQPPIDSARLVRTVPVREVITRDVAPRRVSYQRAPERVIRRTRSVQKSAIIIGSSAGVGAGIGAAAGGKKGALVGALIGGGGATLWDQITRRRQ